jgi:hypothetical protein
LLTPRQTHRRFLAFERQAVRDHNDRAWLAWHIAALPLQKRFPALKSLFIDEPQHRRKPMTPEQTLALVKMMNAAMGGDVIGEIVIH